MMSFISKISRRQLDYLLQRYGNENKTLEVGSYGNPSYGIFFPNRLGIDIRPGPGVDQVCSVYELPFENEEFEQVLCCSVLEHLKEPRKAIQEMKRVLKKEGKIFISVPFLFPIHETPDDFWRFTKFGLQELFKIEEGWEILELRPETNFNQTFAVLFQRIGYQTKWPLNSVLKVMIFGAAWLWDHLPLAPAQVFGDISKKKPESAAFASAYFLVAKKIS